MKKLVKKRKKEEFSIEAFNSCYCKSCMCTCSCSCTIAVVPNSLVYSPGYSGGHNYAIEGQLSENNFRK